MSSNDDDDRFADAYERNTQREHISAYVLVSGLVLQLINAAIWFKGYETVSEMAAYR
jgi:hypothetical protein